MLTPEKERAIREAIGTKTATVADCVYVRRPLIDSKLDWVELLGVENVDGEFELRYCAVDLLQFVDSELEGCDDDPVVNLTYRIRLFHQYKELRSNESNSTDDFNGCVLNLRNLFLQGSRSLGLGEKVETQPLVLSGFIILGDDPFSGAFGHFVELQLSVEVR